MQPSDTERGIGYLVKRVQQSLRRQCDAALRPTRLSMPINALDMRLVHRVLRREFAAIPVLIANVPNGDTARAKVVGDHVTFVVGALHNHHAAEDEMVWPLLHNRVPARADDIERMENQHSDIVGAVERVSASLSVWVGSPGGPTADQLLEAVAGLEAVRGQHLDDQELNTGAII